MAVTKVIEIDGREVRFRASAMIPRMYRVSFGRDIFKDFDLLNRAIEKSSEENSTLDTFSLEVFENIAYMMAKYGDPGNVPEDVNEWLDQFDTFSIYKIMPQLYELWNVNLHNEVQSKKNLDRLTAR